jgi:molybdopterin synthase catalytic subunit
MDRLKELVPIWKKENWADGPTPGCTHSVEPATPPS